MMKLPVGHFLWESHLVSVIKRKLSKTKTTTAMNAALTAILTITA